MARSRRKGEAGYSLLEIFVALLILSLGLLSLAMQQLSALTARPPSAPAGERDAAGLAQDALDRLGAVPFAELASSGSGGFLAGPDGPYPDTSRLPYSAGDSRVVGKTTYYRLWHVGPDPEVPALKTVTVWCCWRQGEGKWRQVALVTQRSDAGY